MAVRKWTLIALMVIGSLLAVPGAAMAETTPSSPAATVTVESNEQHASSGVFIKFVVLSFIKAEGLTKEEVNNAEECRMIGEGTNVPEYTNSGWNADGSLFKFRDTKRVEVCKINGQWRKVECGNFVWFTVPPTVFHGHVLMVRSFAHKRIRLHIPLKVKVTSKCGYAYAAAKIEQWVNLKALVRAKGSVKIRINGKILDRAKSHVKVKSVCETTEPGPPPPPPSSSCKEKPEQEKCKPLVVNLETINDMEASISHEHTRWICFEVHAPVGESLSDLEVALHVDIGETFGDEAEYRGGNQFCQKYKSPGETGTETYYGWARSKKTGAVGESEHKTFPIKAETSF